MEDDPTGAWVYTNGDSNKNNYVKYNVNQALSTIDIDRFAVAK
jgi:hypothetical protein